MDAMTSTVLDTKSDEALVARYIALRNKVNAEEQAFDDRMKPYREAMATIANVLQATLIARGADSTKTGAGTAYLSTTYRVGVKDREALTAYVRLSGNLDMFTNAVSKEAVDQYMEEHDGQLPPGVERTPFQKCNFRKS